MKIDPRIKLADYIKILACVVSITIYVVTTKNNQESDHQAIIMMSANLEKMTENVDKLNTLVISTKDRVEQHEKEIERLYSSRETSSYNDVTHGAQGLMK